MFGIRNIASKNIVMDDKRSYSAAFFRVFIGFKMWFDIIRKSLFEPFSGKDVPEMNDRTRKGAV